MEGFDKKISVSYVAARYQETDQMGVIHHSVYPVWFEVGRTDWIKLAGLTYTDFEKMGIMLPLIELTCTYKGFARYEDELAVRTGIDELSNTRISFSYEISRAGGDKAIIALGKTFHVFVGADLKPVNLKKYNPGVLELLRRQYSDVESRNLE